MPPSMSPGEDAVTAREQSVGAPRPRQAGHRVRRPVAQRRLHDQELGQAGQFATLGERGVWVAVVVVRRWG